MLKTTFITNAEILPNAANNFNFLIPEAKLAFLQLRQAVINVFILYHFDPEYYIQIETNVFGYAIVGILSYLTSNSE